MFDLPTGIGVHYVVAGMQAIEVSTLFTAHTVRARSRICTADRSRERLPGRPPQLVTIHALVHPRIPILNSPMNIGRRFSRAAALSLLVISIASLARPLTAGQSPATVATVDPGPTDFVQQPFDVLHYDLTMRFGTGRTVTSAVSTVQLVWVDDPQGNAFIFHLRDLTVDSVTYSSGSGIPLPVGFHSVGKPVDADYHFEVTPPSTARKGDTAEIRIAYSGTMSGEVWGGVHRDPQPRNGASDTVVYALGAGVDADYVSMTRHWLACYDHPSDKATFTGHFTVDSGMVVSNGIGPILTPAVGGATTYTWQLASPASTYLLTFAHSTYVPVDVGTDPVPMRVFANTVDTAATHESFRLLPRMVQTFARLFVPYPFAALGYVNTPKGAMEHQTMISFPTYLSRSRDTVNTIAAHELLHQWFGDLVSPRDFRDTWLNESFATLGQSLWAEELGGKTAWLQEQSGDITQYISSDAPREGVFPIYDFDRQPPSSNYPGTIYEKGSAVLGMLRYELGDSAFFRGLRDYLTTNAYSTATTDSMQAALERSAGRSLQSFFDQWIYGKGWPMLTVNLATEPSSGGTRATVSIDQVQPADYGVYTHLPVELGFRDPEGGITYRVVSLDDTSQTFTIDSLPAISGLTVNDGPTVRSLLQVRTITGVPLTTSDSNDVRFTVHPNPASDTQVLHVRAENVDNCNGIGYEIYDTAGRRVVVGTAGSCEFTIPIQGFPSGAFIVRFKYAGTYYDVPVSILE